MPRASYKALSLGRSLMFRPTVQHQPDGKPSKHISPWKVNRGTERHDDAYRETMSGFRPTDKAHGINLYGIRKLF